VVSILELVQGSKCTKFTSSNGDTCDDLTKEDELVLVKTLEADFNKGGHG